MPLLGTDPEWQARVAADPRGETIKFLRSSLLGQYAGEVKMAMPVWMIEIILAEMETVEALHY